MRGIFTNIHELEASNCFSIITQEIIEIPKERNVKFYLSLSRISKHSVNVENVAAIRTSWFHLKTYRNSQMVN